MKANDTLAGAARLKLSKYGDVPGPEVRRYVADQDKSEIWEEYPVGVREFIDSEEYLNAADECWPAVKDDVEELFEKNYEEAVFDEAIGAGKSYKSSIILTYGVYRLLCLREPRKYFRLAKGSKITLLNMSRTAKQAKDVVFGEVRARIDNSPWFNKYYMPDDSIKSELRFAKNILIFPGNSKSTFPLGYNIFMAIMDEAAWYMDTNDKDAAEEMYYVLQRRIKSRFMQKNEMRGLLIMISNPRYVFDFIERKFKESLTDENIFGRRRSVWEAKPSWYWSGETFELDGVEIPIELKNDFDKDRAKAWRDHGAKPSRVLEPYFQEYDRIYPCIKGNTPFREDGSYKKTFKGIGRFKYYGHVDLGYKRDACGVVLGHKGEEEKVVIDLMMKIIPPGRGLEIRISDVRRIMIHLKRVLKFNIRKVSYDGFQSVESRQELERAGLETELLSIGLEQYDTLKDVMYDEKMEFYEFQPFMDEVQELELINGTKIDHPPFGSKDVADAVAGVTWWCVQDRFWTNKSYALIEPEGYEDEDGVDDGSPYVRENKNTFSQGSYYDDDNEEEE